MPVVFTNVAESFYDKYPNAVIGIGAVAGAAVLACVIFVLVKTHLYRKQMAHEKPEATNLKMTAVAPMHTSQEFNSDIILSQL